MLRMRECLARLRSNSLFWFISLWLFGVAMTGLLVLPFHLLVAMAMRAT